MQTIEMPTVTCSLVVDGQTRRTVQGSDADLLIRYLRDWLKATVKPQNRRDFSIQIETQETE